MESEGTWEGLGLCDELRASVVRIGWNQPTAIQRQTIPRILGGEDIAGASETGSGKTGCYVLPLIQRILLERPESPFAIVLTASHDLVRQIVDVIGSISASVAALEVTGGPSAVQQVMDMQKKPDVLVATPGRLAAIVRTAKGVSLGCVRAVVVDEVDQMTTVYDDVAAVLNAVARDRQLLIFSATLPANIERLARLSVHSGGLVRLSEKHEVPKTIEEFVLPVEERAKDATVAAVLEEVMPGRVLIFTSTVRAGDILYETLKGAVRGARFGFVCGRVSDEERREVLRKFQAGELNVLVATQVVARGFDAPGTDVVVLYDVPECPRDYVHRVGRVGRAGARGVAITMVCREDLARFGAVEALLGRRLEVFPVAADRTAKWSAAICAAHAKAVARFKAESRRHDRALRAPERTNKAERR